MAPTDLASLLREYGGWGLSAILIVALVYSVKEWKGCFEARIADGGTMIAALTEAKLTNAAVVAALESRIGYFERLGNQVENAGQAAEIKLELIQAAVAENQRTLDDLRRGRS